MKEKRPYAPPSNDSEEKLSGTEPQRVDYKTADETITQELLARHLEWLRKEFAK